MKKFKYPTIVSARVLILCLTALILMSNSYGKSKLKNQHEAKKSFGFKIIVKLIDAKPNDTLTLSLIDPMSQVSESRNLGCYLAPNVNGTFIFTVNSKDQYGYFDLQKPRTYTYRGDSFILRSLMYPQFWERGDSIVIDLTSQETVGGIHYSARFRGNGAGKYNARYIIDSMRYNTISPLKTPLFDKNYVYHPDNEYVIHKQLTILNKYKNSISPDGYNALKADIIFSGGKSRFSAIRSYFQDSIATAPDSIKSNFINAYNQQFTHLNTHQIPTGILATSSLFLYYMFNKFMTDASLAGKHNVIIGNENYQPIWEYNRIKETTKGLIRERITTIMLLEERRDNNFSKMLADARTFVKDSVCSLILQRMDNTNVGTQLENYIFQDTSGHKYKTNDFKRKVLVIDLWGTGCGGCSILYRNALKPMESIYRGNPDIVFLSVNTDKEKKQWIKGIESGRYTGKEALNVYTNGKGFNHSIVINNNIVYIPFAILVDKNGVVRSMNGNELYNSDSLHQHIEQLLNQ